MESHATLDTPIEYLKGVGPQRADVLKKEAAIFRFRDLLFTFPFRYIDRTKFHNVIDINPHSPYIQLRGKLFDVTLLGQSNKKRLVARLQDDSGSIELVWFKGIKWIAPSLQEGKEYIVFGKPSLFNKRFNMVHPETELISQETNLSLQKGLQAVYPSTEKLKNKGLDSKGIHKLMKALFSRIDDVDIKENLPGYILEKYKMCGRFDALRMIHLPKNERETVEGSRRMKFEELFFIQMQLLKMKQSNKQLPGFVFPLIGDVFNSFYNEKLPFDLTHAQKKVIREIRNDLRSGSQMNRLLQGDVGSGKTVVALLTMLMAIENGYQAAMMAPTEILALQHYANFQKLLQGLPVKVALLTGNIKGKERKAVLHQLQDGEINIIVGTHALIEDAVDFQKLGIVVIDEQHRFGVAQRAKMWKKGNRLPHILVMTATPIPRTLAMTLYGDLDVSVIDELPPGRKQIVTTHKTDSSRLRLFGFMKEQIALGRQIYMVYPLIAESEKLDYKYLEDGYESICREFRKPEYHVSIVHGQMRKDVRDFEMERFVAGKTNIMIATTVIEVGVDVPNASVMIIESAERFGLSQLHQLRGRVGRGADQSYCILMTADKLTPDALKRIRTMCQTNDGFKIAEVDMQLRGPGDIQGTQQSGLLNMKIANLATDQHILAEARKMALAIFEKDPGLELPAHRPLKVALNRKKKGLISWSDIS